MSITLLLAILECILQAHISNYNYNYKGAHMINNYSIACNFRVYFTGTYQQLHLRLQLVYRPDCLSHHQMLFGFASETVSVKLNKKYQQLHSRLQLVYQLASW